MPGPENSSNSLKASDQDASKAGVDYKAQLDAAAERVKDPDSGRNGNGGVLERGGFFWTCARPSEGNLALHAFPGAAVSLTGTQTKKKVSHYVPAIGRMLGNEDEPPPAKPAAEVPGPPERPEHDPQIQEFVRAQHMSKNISEGSE